jgi:hypothetical protein
MGILHGEDKRLHRVDAICMKSALAIRPFNLVFATVVIAILSGL